MCKRQENYDPYSEKRSQYKKQLQVGPDVGLADQDFKATAINIFTEWLRKYVQ